MSYWASWEKGVSQYTQDSASGIHKVIYVGVRLDSSGTERPAHQRTHFYFKKHGDIEAGSRITYDRYGYDWDSWASAIEGHVVAFRYPPSRYHVETLKEAEYLEGVLKQGGVENTNTPGATTEEKKDALYAAIEELPMAQHDAVILKLGGYSHVEIAKILGCTEHQSRHRVYDAMVSLKKNPKLIGS